jgi:hypothetical protein
VRGHDPASIIANLERRIANDSELERRTALSQIATIAAYRLADLVSSPPGPEILAMLERLARADQQPTATTANAMIREWMQAAGLELCTPAGGCLVGRVDGGEPYAKTLLAGACLDTRHGTLHYQGRASFLIGIEAAQQLRHHGDRPACGLVVLARPEDKRDSGGLASADGPGSWVELDAVDVARAAAADDAETREIMQALRLAGLHDAGEGAATLVHRAGSEASERAEDQGAGGEITAAAAERAVRALQAILGRVAAAA